MAFLTTMSMLLLLLLLLMKLDWFLNSRRTEILLNFNARQPYKNIKVINAAETDIVTQIITESIGARLPNNSRFCDVVSFVIAVDVVVLRTTVDVIDVAVAEAYCEIFPRLTLEQILSFDSVKKIHFSEQIHLNIARNLHHDSQF
ncbi:hypothetical protein HELRODRAFT_182582 [Helobdella robusta]|uniref:Uncharacterized protein n=1 Tax=Helobdella robusta TaxID=6412 RepID=T1FIE5_HELRO|nr:hypothetical protein HELRODRAFT_182582 [Helobdella robusta]ESN90873.1 hypothetical protein HELRODRAFT_182582 [Helobdella robusta]